MQLPPQLFSRARRGRAAQSTKSQLVEPRSAAAKLLPSVTDLADGRQQPVVRAVWRGGVRVA